ncbi:MAG: hypothetical protein PWQ41_837 [Bacillota bacterium]|nr:hypothetical protein [Bacillota bacterium]
MEEPAELRARLLRRRWLVWGMLALSFLIVFFHRIALAVVADQLMAEWSLTASALGNLGAMYFYVYTIMQIPSGALADTLGPRVTASTGTLVAGIGSVVFGLAPSFGAALFGRFLVGLGVSVIFLSVLKVQTEWFRTREFATITGLTSAVGNSGNALAATPLAWLVAAIGWRFSFVVVGILGVLVAAGCWFFVRNRPEDLGLPSITEIEAWEDGALSSACRLPPARPVPLRQALAYVTRSSYTLPLFVGAFGLNGSLMVLSAMWGIPYLMQVYGLNRAQASLYTLGTALGIMLAGPLSGLISDRLRRRRGPLLAFTALTLFAWVVLVAWPGRLPLPLLRFLFFFLGLGSGGYLLIMCLAKEVSPHAIAGVATGTINTGSCLGAAVLQLLVGLVLDATWDGRLVVGVRLYSPTSYRLGFLRCTLVVAVSFLAALRLPETHARNIAPEYPFPEREPLRVD